MSAVTYTATRGLIAGHTVDLEYSLDLLTVDLDERRVVGREQQRSLSDKTETLWYFGVDEWSVRVVAQGEAALLALKEFLKSTEGGEIFEFDAYGSVSTPDAPVNVRRESPEYGLERITNNGTPDDAFEVTFTVREA